MNILHTYTCSIIHHLGPDMRELVLGLQPDKAQSSKLSYRDYGKCAKISITLFIFFLNKKSGSTKFLSEKQTEKTLIRLLHQKQSDLGLHCLSKCFWPVCLGLFGKQLVFKILEHLS